MFEKHLGDIGVVVRCSVLCEGAGRVVVFTAGRVLGVAAGWVLCDEAAGAGSLCV